MKHDKKTCNILGRYCWTHKAVVEVGIPGWPRTGSGNEYTHYSPWASNTHGGVTEAVIWANGDVSRVKDQSACAVCDKHCQHPVERSFLNQRDGYGEIRVKKIAE